MKHDDEAHRVEKEEGNPVKHQLRWAVHLYESLKKKKMLVKPTDKNWLDEDEALNLNHWKSTHICTWF